MHVKTDHVMITGNTLSCYVMMHVKNRARYDYRIII